MIYEQPSIYKSGLELQEVIDEIKKDETIKFKLLSKYENYINVAEWPNYPMDFKIKENSGIFIFSLAIPVKASFNMYYSASDIVGDSSFPAIGYFEYPRGEILDTFWQVCQLPNGNYIKYALTRYPDKDYIAVRLPNNQSLINGHIWLYNMSIYI